MNLMQEGWPKVEGSDMGYEMGKVSSVFTSREGISVLRALTFFHCVQLNVNIICFDSYITFIHFDSYK